MQAKTATGLIGANTYLQETRVPMKVFKEARAEGDTAKMERAMGYLEKLGGTALEYKKQADKGLREDAEKAKKEAQEQRDKLEQRIKESRTEAEQQLKEARDTETQENAAAESGSEVSTATSDSTPNLTYTKDGEVKEQSMEAEFDAVV